MQLFTGINLDHREVGIFIDANHLGRVLRGVTADLDLDLRGLIDNVIVGEDIAGLVENDAGAQATFGLRLPLTAGPSIEEMKKEVFARIVGI